MTWRRIETHDGSHDSVLLGSSGHFDEPPWTAQGYRQRGDWFVDGATEPALVSPTHWQPLPEPPQPEKELAA